MLDVGIDPSSPLPRYYQIYSALREKIALGDLKPGQVLPPERHIAEVCGVARLTVVKALDLLARDGLIDRQHGRGTFVQEPNKPEGRLLDMLAFICSPRYADDLLMGISRTAFENRYHLQLLGVDRQFKHLGAYLEACLASGVQGFLIFGRPGSGDVATYQRLLGRGVPIVMVDRYYPQLECDHVVYNNEEVCYQLTERLIGRGHHTIAIMPGAELDTTAVRDRLSGYRKALEGHGIAYNEDLVWLDIYDTAQPLGVVNETYQRKLRERLETSRPSAILTINATIADAVMHDLVFLQSSPKRSVRKNNAELGDYTAIELATFSDRPRADIDVVAVHPAMQLGQISAKLLIDRLRGAVTGPARHVVIPMDIVELPARVRQISYGKESSQKVDWEDAGG